MYLSATNGGGEGGGGTLFASYLEDAFEMIWKRSSRLYSIHKKIVTLFE